MSNLANSNASSTHKVLALAWEVLTFFLSSRCRYLAVNMEGRRLFPEQNPLKVVDDVENGDEDKDVDESPYADILQGAGFL